MLTSSNSEERGKILGSGAASATLAVVWKPSWFKFYDWLVPFPSRDHHFRPVDLNASVTFREGVDDVIGFYEQTGSQQVSLNVLEQSCWFIHQNSSFTARILHSARATAWIHGSCFELCTGGARVWDWRNVQLERWLPSPQLCFVVQIPGTTFVGKRNGNIYLIEAQHRFASSNRVRNLRLRTWWPLRGRWSFNSGALPNYLGVNQLTECPFFWCRSYTAFPLWWPSISLCNPLFVLFNWKSQREYRCWLQLAS